MMLKFNRQEDPKRSLEISCLLLIILCFCILHTFVVFHSRFDSSPIAPGGANGAHKVVLHREVHLNALKEIDQSDAGEIRKRIEVKPTKPKPSLYKPPINVTAAERIRWFTENYSSFKVLHPDALSLRFRSKVKGFFQSGCKGRFFMTWIGPLEFFGPREFLSIESIFKFHPKSCILIISRSLDCYQGRQLFLPFVSRGFKIVAAAPDVSFLFKNTPAEAWLADVVAGKSDPGEIPFPQNLSNILRLAALYKYGGIYLDSDVVVLKSLLNLSNVIGAQNVDPDNGVWNRLNNAVLVFDKRHPLLFKFIQEFAFTFNGNKWGHNGPYLVTRVLNRLGNWSNESFVVNVLPPMAFYPVDWTRIHSYFSRPTDAAGHKWIAAKLLQMRGQTFAIHLWNKQSREFLVEEKSLLYHVFNKCCIICDQKKILSGSNCSKR